MARAAGAVYLRIDSIEQALRRRLSAASLPGMPVRLNADISSG